MKQVTQQNQNIGILFILFTTTVLALLLTVTLKLKANSNSSELSSTEGAAAYTAISEITLETNHAIEMGQKMYEQAFPAIQKFADETVAFIRENRNKPADAIANIYNHQTNFTEDYSNSMTHFDYFTANNWAARSESAEKQYNQLLSNPQISSQYQSGLRILNENELLNSHLLGRQSVR